MTSKKHKSGLTLLKTDDMVEKLTERFETFCFIGRNSGLKDEHDYAVYFHGDADACAGMCLRAIATIKKASE